jgi:uncharacterized protein YgbK (DUF1537 family)
MAKSLVIADDVTGANATGVLLKKSGLETYTVLNAAHANDKEIEGCDCVTVATESRSIQADEAYERVQRVLGTIDRKNITLYSKRIDSTLRGNLGSETDAFLDTLGPEYIAACVPCFPTSGRILVGGYMLVNGVLLHRTSIANDPKNPINTSNAVDLYRKQTKYRVGWIALDDIERGAEHLAAVVTKMVAGGVRIVIFDSVIQEHIDTIADALIIAKLKYVAVDPGVFTAASAKRLVGKSAKRGGGKVLCAIGSVNDVARAQVSHLLSQLNVLNVYVEISEILESPERRAAEIKRVSDEIIKGCDDYGICSLIGCGIDPARQIPFEPYMEKQKKTAQELSELINTAMAEMVFRVISENKDFRGVYSTGGDITAAINRRVEITGLRLIDEVLPLACYGEMVGGRFPGLKFISKGGSQGKADAMTVCVQYLQSRI